MKRAAAPRSSLRALIKKQKPHLRLAANVDLLVHLNCLLFLQRLAAEARTKAIESKHSTIKPAHITAVAKAVLKKSRG
ncbi:centromere protein W isoform X2 [Rhinatrema bivittatum]|uniref:centromere protein W isoform X2 n=1 Tax=Rhinatrema bivittatum TaxID=194408 RepID=UPI0011273A4D|nr:centromere protein W isoform X2 [Rhinatrema bivittatum]